MYQDNQAYQEANHVGDLVLWPRKSDLLVEHRQRSPVGPSGTIDGDSAITPQDSSSLLELQGHSSSFWFRISNSSLWQKRLKGQAYVRHACLYYPGKKVVS